MRPSTFFAGSPNFGNFFLDALTVFMFVVWFWLVMTVIGDLVRRHDVSGWGKAFWVIFVLVAPYLGILVYMISQGRGIAARNAARSQQARQELRSAVGFSTVDEIEKLDRLKKSGAITDNEFARLRDKLVA